MLFILFYFFFSREEIKLSFLFSFKSLRFLRSLLSRKFPPPRKMEQQFVAIWLYTTNSKLSYQLWAQILREVFCAQAASIPYRPPILLNLVKKRMTLNFL